MMKIGSRVIEINLGTQSAKYLITVKTCIPQQVHPNLMETPHKCTMLPQLLL